MPNRIIREAILSSEKVSLLGWPDEVFYRRLMSIVDDYGRAEANPQLLRARCYPLQTDAVRVTDISRWMAACQKAGLILCYAVQGKQYLEVRNFQQQQRTASKWPSPTPSDNSCNQLIANDCLGVVGVVSVVEDEGVVGGVPRKGAAPPRKAPTKGQIPDDFAVSDRVRAWAKEKGFDRLDEHCDAFIRKCKAKGYSYADFDLAFMEAVREDWAKLRGRSGGGLTVVGSSGDAEEARRAATTAEARAKIFGNKAANHA